MFHDSRLPTGRTQTHTHTYTHSDEIQAFDSNKLEQKLIYHVQSQKLCVSVLLASCSHCKWNESLDLLLSFGHAISKIPSPWMCVCVCMSRHIEFGRTIQVNMHCNCVRDKSMRWTWHIRTNDHRNEQNPGTLILPVVAPCSAVPWPPRPPYPAYAMYLIR